MYRLEISIVSNDSKPYDFLVQFIAILMAGAPVVKILNRKFLAYLWLTKMEQSLTLVNN